MPRNAPAGSYELAVTNSSSHQYDLAKLYILRAGQQNLALRKMNVELQEKIDNLKKILL